MATGGASMEVKEEIISQESDSKPSIKKPTCIIVLGMAGSGKTTFVQVCHISCYVKIGQQCHTFTSRVD